MKTFAKKTKRPTHPAHRSRAAVLPFFNPAAQGQRAQVRQALRATRIQAKLTISQPNDKHEQEADRMAEAVMRMPAPQMQRQPENNEEKQEELIRTKPISAKITPLIQRRVIPEDEERQVQARGNGKTSRVTPYFKSGLNILGNGQPLSKETRAFFEPRFGRDFSGVRVHTDYRANQLTRSINARAFTKENDIVFGKGEFAPETKKGRNLIAHELVHTIQQTNIRNTINCYPRGVLEEMAIRRGRQLADPHFPVDISVIDDSDLTGWLAAFTRTGEVYMQDVHTMVSNVLTAAGTHPIRRLDILDHGNPNGIQIGSDYINLSNIATFGIELRRLNGRFTNNGFVHLQHCEIGQNQALMSAFAALVGATVYGGTGSQNPIYRFNLGDYVRCNPSGHCEADVGRPW